MPTSKVSIPLTTTDPFQRTQAFLTAMVGDPSYNGWDASLFRQHLRLESVSLPSSSTSNSSPQYPTASFQLTVTRPLTNRMNNLHGGCIATLFDICTTSALALVAEEGNGWEFAGVSRSLNCTYLRGVGEGEEVEVRAMVVGLGRRLCQLRGEIWSKGKLCCMGEHGKVSIDPTGKL